MQQNFQGKKIRPYLNIFHQIYHQTIIFLLLLICLFSPQGGFMSNNDQQK